MTSTARSTLAAALLACLALSGCGDGSDGKDGLNGKNGLNGKDGSSGVPGASMLVRTVDEPAGANCASGGQKLQLGKDVNGNGQLDDGEVQDTRYVCNGNSIVGPQGPQGLQGPPASGQFALAQMIKSELLTCDSVIVTANASKCVEPKVNGFFMLDLQDRAGGGGLSTFCAVVTGNEDKSPQLEGTISYRTRDTFYAWDNSSWRIASDAFYSYARLVSISCSLSRPW